MEKDSEISELTSKLKKIEFKHSRDIKDLKMAEERAKQLLKQEKLKLDKISKQANQNFEQNQLLQHRLTEQKQEKDKQIETVRAQYNSIKEEVRSYERILPTHTFLTELGQSIHQIFTYEDIFMNLKEKTLQCQQSKLKIQAVQKQLAQFQRNSEANEQILKQKKNEAQKSLKQMLAKLFEHETQLSDTKTANSQLQQRLNETQNLLQAQKQLVLAYKQEIRQYELKFEEVLHEHTQELHHKEEEIRSLTMVEFQKYEEEINFLKGRAENKENMYMQQIAILEEERSDVQNHFQKEKERYQENYTQLKEHAIMLKDKLDDQKRINIQLAQKTNQLRKQLVELSSDKELLLTQVKTLQTQLTKQNIEQYQIKCQQMQKQNSLQDKQMSTFISKLHLIQDENKSLNETLQKYEDQIRKLTQINNNQSSELDDLKAQKRSRALSFGDSSEDMLYSLRKSIEEVVVPMRKSIEENPLPLTNPQSSSLIEVDEDKEKISDLTKQIEALSIENNNLKASEKLLSNKQNELELSIASLTNRVSFSKSKIDSLEEEYAIISAELSKEKGISKNLKEQLKDAKSVNIAALDKYTKEMKQLQTQNELLKHEKQKLKADFLVREKAYIHEMAVLKSQIQKAQKSNNRLQKQNEQRCQMQKQYELSLQKMKDVLKQIDRLKKQVIALEENNICQDRQIEILTDSLERERKQRTLRTVPSLHHLEDDEVEEENFKAQYNTIGQKEGEIYMLNREISDLKEEIQHMKERNNAKIEAIQAERSEYIQQIIKMKMKVAESEMRAAQKQHLYNQLKKKMVNGK